jgi:hypothetical protein
MMPNPEPAATSIPARCFRCGRAGEPIRPEEVVVALNETTGAEQTEQEYVRAVLRAYVALPETPQRWHSTDRQIAVGLFRRKISVQIVETAFVLGSARRLSRDPQNIVPPIRCLAYFLPVIDEVLAQPPSSDYIAYLRWRLPDLVRKVGLIVDTT